MIVISEMHEFEKFLQTKFDNLNEANGVYDLTHEIINTCYTYIKNNLNQIHYISTENKNGNVYNVHVGNFTIPLNGKPFIINPIIKLTINVGDYVREPTGGLTLPTIDMIQDNKLVNPVIRIEMFEKYKNTISYSSFKQLMLHEIHHAYRWFNINSSSNDSEKNNEKRKKDSYLYFSRNKDNSDQDNILYSIFYLTDDGEINAFSTEIHGIVEDNPEINAGNYRSFLHSFPAYRHIKALENALQFFKNREYDTTYNINYYNSISNKMNKVFKTNETPQRNRRKIISLLTNRVLKMYKQFYKILDKSLVDFNRHYNITESNRNIGRFLIDDMENDYNFNNY